VPVRDVVTDYRTRAVEALDSMTLAPSETEAVQSYFDHLAGSTGAE
jgi:GTP-sensing pleiotropic transcriptional regulator CodY